MTLLEYAQHICAKVGTPDDESVALCKVFVARKYKAIWDTHPWRETLTVTQATVAAAAERLVSPIELERVLAICWEDSVPLDAVEWTNLFLRDPGAFAQAAGAGTLGFTLLGNSLVNYDMGPYVGDSFDLIFVHDGTNAGQTVTLIGSLPDGSRLQTTYTLTDNLESTEPKNRMHNPFVLLLALTWPTMPASTALHFRLDTSDGFVTRFGTVAGQQLGKFPVVRLWSPPQTGTTARVLGKLPCNVLSADQDTPLLFNIDECLIAYGQAEMLERQRQYTKAQAKKQEGNEELGKLLDLQRRQTADGFQIIPWTEGGGAYGEALTGKTFW